MVDDFGALKPTRFDELANPLHRALTRAAALQARAAGARRIENMIHENLSGKLVADDRQAVFVKHIRQRDACVLKIGYDAHTAITIARAASGDLSGLGCMGNHASLWYHGCLDFIPLEAYAARRSHKKSIRLQNTGQCTPPAIRIRGLLAQPCGAHVASPAHSL